MRPLRLVALLAVSLAACATPAGPLLPHVAPDADAAQRVLRLVAWHTDPDTGWRGWSAGSVIPISVRQTVDGIEILALTAAHVVEDGEDMELHIFASPGFQEPVASAIVLEVLPHPRLDCALVVARASSASVPVLELSARGPVVGERVLLSGYPWAMRLHVTDALICGVAALGDDFPGDVWHVSTIVTPGMSGGAMLAEDGTVLGIIVARDIRTDDGSGIGYVLSIECVREWLESALPW